jgi:hypothetical protein
VPSILRVVVVVMGVCGRWTSAVMVDIEIGVQIHQEDEESSESAGAPLHCRRLIRQTVFFFGRTGGVKLAEADVLLCSAEASYQYCGKLILRGLLHCH